MIYEEFHLIAGHIQCALYMHTGRVLTFRVFDLTENECSFVSQISLTVTYFESHTEPCISLWVTE